MHQISMRRLYQASPGSAALKESAGDFGEWDRANGEANETRLFQRSAPRGCVPVEWSWSVSPSGLAVFRTRPDARLDAMANRVGVSILHKATGVT